MRWTFWRIPRYSLYKSYHHDGRYVSQRMFASDAGKVDDRTKLSLQHYINKKRASFQHRYPSSNPLTLQHACNVASAWQSSGIVNMLELRRELLRSQFIFDVWPQSNSYGKHQHLYNTQQPIHDVIIARFPHQLHEKYGDPHTSNIMSKIRDKMNTTTSSSIKRRRKLSADEKWNKDFWFPSNLSSLDPLLNYPMPGDNHHNDADSPLSISTSSHSLTDYLHSKRLKAMTPHEFEPNHNDSNNELLHRGYVFIFSSGCIVTWGYNGRDRDWIDSFLQLYQNKKKGWPSFDGFKLPFWVTIPLFMSDRSFLNPNDMKIVRTDFLNLNWVIDKKMDVNKNLRVFKRFGDQSLSNDIESWDIYDVQRWLECSGLNKYCPIFEDHEIDGKMLLNFSSSTASASHKLSSSSSSLSSNTHQLFIEKVLLNTIQSNTSSVRDYVIFMEELNKLNINKEDIFSEDDILCLPPNTDLNTLIAISYALAQCARLEALKVAVNYYQKNLMVITEKLAKKGRIYFLTKNHWSKLVHHCEMLRDLLFDFGAQPILTQVPHFIEQRSAESEAIYNAVLDYLDFEDDVAELSSQIEQLKNRYESDWEACRDNYGFRLEMIIILFFAIDTWEFWCDGFAFVRSKLFNHKTLVQNDDYEDEEGQLLDHMALDAPALSEM
eukprot:238394_1